MALIITKAKKPKNIETKKYRNQRQTTQEIETRAERNERQKERKIKHKYKLIT